MIDIFADAIGEITNKQAVAFDHLWVWTSKIVNLASPNPLADITSFVFPLLNINPEGKLQREIKDIIDELDIMMLINRQQLTVIRTFVKHAEDILDPQGIWRDQKGSMFETTEDVSTPDSDKKPASPTMEEEKAKAALFQKKKKDYLWFKAQADEVISDIESHIDELDGLRASAVSTSSSLDNLLGLMQQQASALQAWQSSRQAEETVKQGRAIIIFTTVTIIFVSPIARHFHLVHALNGLTSSRLTASPVLHCRHIRDEQLRLIRQYRRQHHDLPRPAPLHAANLPHRHPGSPPPGLRSQIKAHSSRILELRCHVSRHRERRVQSLADNDMAAR